MGSSSEDIPKTSKISKQISESCSSNAETDPEGENVSQLSDVLIQHGKKKATGGAGNKPTISNSNEVQKIKMPFDKLVVNVKRLDETVLHPHDLKRFREWKEKQSKDHQHPTTSDITDNQISEKIKNLETELKSTKDMLACKEQESQKHLETSRKNDQHYEQQSKVREKDFTEQLKAKEKTLQETDDKLQN